MGTLNEFAQKQVAKSRGVGRGPTVTPRAKVQRRSTAMAQKGSTAAIMSRTFRSGPVSI